MEVSFCFSSGELSNHKLGPGLSNHKLGPGRSNSATLRFRFGISVLAILIALPLQITDL